MLMKFRVFLILLLLSICGNSLYAQYNPQAENKYKAGLSDFKQQRYAAAMEKLSTLTTANAKSSYSPYAHY